MVRPLEAVIPADLARRAIRPRKEPRLVPVLRRMLGVPAVPDPTMLVVEGTVTQPVGLGDKPREACWSYGRSGLLGRVHEPLP